LDPTDSLSLKLQITDLSLNGWDCKSQPAIAAVDVPFKPFRILKSSSVRLVLVGVASEDVN
jgi:hypothetical protein